MTNSTKILIGAGLGVLALLLVRGIGKDMAKTAGAAVDYVEAKLSPTSQGNIIYDGIIGGTGRALSGNNDWSLGTWLYDVTH